MPLLKTHYTIFIRSFEVAIIHICVNDIISNRNSPGFDHVFKKCRSYGIENIFISGLLQTASMTKDVIRKINKLIKDIDEVERCFFMFLMIT